MTRRLIRESDPPAGQLASPVPQYWNPNTEAFEDVLGAHGAPRAILYGPNGQPIGSSNPLPVADSALAQAVAQLATEGKLEEARALLETISQKDFATQTTLSEVLQRLEAIEEQLETGDAKVQLKGSNVPTKLAAAPRDTIVYRQNYSIAANTEVIVADIKGRPCDLESLALGTNYVNMAIIVRPYLHDGTLGAGMGLPRNDGTGLVEVLPGALQNHWNGENDFFKNFLYDNTNNKFSLGMKRQAKFNNGVRVSLRNFDSSLAHDAAIIMVISTWEV